MKHFYLFKWLLVLTSLLSLSSCERELITPSPLSAAQVAAVTAATYEEGYETAYKGSYATASVSFAGGSWIFQEALTGNTAADGKTGSQSARIRDLGKLTMEFDLPDGAKSISLQYAKYGKDKNSQLEVYFSTNGGTTWQKAGSTLTVSNTALQQLTIPLSVQGTVRFEIRKASGSGYRLNIDNVVVEPNPAVTAPDFKEDYEAGSKGSYASGSVSLGTGNWYLHEALLGTLDTDRKTGAKAVRIRDLGTLDMQFDVQGAQSVSISHAVYGTDGASTWQLQASTDGGASWTAVGNSVTSSSTLLQTATFAVSYTAAVRFRVVKLTGSGTRLNIDDFTIGGAASGDTGGDTGGGGTADTTFYASVHLSLGNPSGATPDASQPNNYLLQKEEYVISYSRDRGTANWVSWHLDEAWLGSTPRQDDFRADNTLPAGWYQVSATDYSLSGFDRGHMTPSADRTLSVDDNSNTFFMTNMVPQAPNNNRIGWASLESYCRSMLSGGYEVYIISGVYGVGGTGSNGYATTIANGRVTVPSNTWKVILIIPDGDNDAARVTSNTRVIAVDMPNDQAVSSDWRAYRTSVDVIEARTGYDFLSLVADNTESVLEASVDAL